MSYEFKTTPDPHQLEEFNARLHVPAWGLRWEQGVGKSKPVIDQAAALYEEQVVNTLMVVAPQGVDLNWGTDELPAHLPDRLRPRTRVFHLRSGKLDTLYHQSEMREIVEHDGLAVVTFSFGGFMTSRRGKGRQKWGGKEFAWKVLQNRRAFYVVDEAHHIKTPGAKQTISIVASGKYAPFRRTLTGTPVTQGPFDLYSQVKFLDPLFWVKQGVGSTFSEFRRFFGEWEIPGAPIAGERGYDPLTNGLRGYRNLDRLEEMLRLISGRLTKEDAGLKLPPKRYSKRRFELTREQRAVYDRLRSELMVELRGGWIDGNMAIVRLLRLQQIACGYAVTDAEEPVVTFAKNPRLDATIDMCDQLGTQAIVWARFTHDIDQICASLGSRAVRYDGAISDDECQRSKLAFQRGDAQIFVGNPAKGSEGLTLLGGRTVFYYSNSFKLKDRLQSEDRSHRRGQDTAVSYVDLTAHDTVDDHIIRALRGKFDIANQINGDVLREWI